MADAGHPHPRVLDPRLHRARERLARRSRRSAQQGAARLQRDPLRVHLEHRQQRQRLRGHLGEHCLLQPDGRPGDAVRPLPDDRADDRHRRLAGEEEARAAVERDVPDQHAAVRRAARRRHPDRRRAHVLPGALARSDRRPSAHVGRQGSSRGSTSMSRAKSSIFDPALLRPAILDSFRKLDPRH